MAGFKKVLLFLLDSVGVGELPDAAQYGDAGAATVQHTLERNPGLTLPNLERLGLMAIPGMEQFSTGVIPEGRYGKCREQSKGKDSIVGHWEVMGLPTPMAFDTFPEGFPPEILEPFTAAIGRGILGNEVASGTEIIQRLGEEHQKTGKPIVYTSADSVFQVAAHEETVPLPILYEWCEKARALLNELPYGVGRVIARPFVGEPGNYTRTANRHDYAVYPPGDTDLEILSRAGIPFHSIGKPSDIFPEAAFTSTRKTSGNEEGMAAALAALKEKDGLIFVNLLDYDQKWGHRRDPAGYGAGLKAFDDFLPTVTQTMGPEDLLIITADHGCDPTHHGTDHTREHIPFLLWHRGIEPRPLGVRETFADIGATVLDALGAPEPECGVSVL